MTSLSPHFTPLPISIRKPSTIQTHFPFSFSPIKRLSQSRLVSCSSSSKDSLNSVPTGDCNLSNFCIIEGPDTVQDFSQMQVQEIHDNISSRRNKIFLLMEEVRRLRVQQRLRSMRVIDESGETNEMPDITSSIPFLSNVELYKYVARKVAVIGVGQVGYMPIEITRFGADITQLNDAVELLNEQQTLVIDLNANLTDAMFTFLNTTGISSDSNGEQSTNLQNKTGSSKPTRHAASP